MASTPPFPRRRQRGAAPLQPYGVGGRGPQRVLTAVLPMLGMTSIVSIFVAGMRMMPLVMVEMVADMVSEVNWISAAAATVPAAAAASACLRLVMEEVCAVILVYLTGPSLPQKIESATGVTVLLGKMGPLIAPCVNGIGSIGTALMMNHGGGSSGDTAHRAWVGMCLVVVKLLSLSVVVSVLNGVWMALGVLMPLVNIAEKRVGGTSLARCFFILTCRASSLLPHVALMMAAQPLGARALYQLLALGIGLIRLRRHSLLALVEPGCCPGSGLLRGCTFHISPLPVGTRSTAAPIVRLASLDTLTHDQARHDGDGSRRVVQAAATTRDPATRGARGGPDDAGIRHPADRRRDARGIRGRGGTPGASARGSAHPTVRARTVDGLGEHVPSDGGRRTAEGTIRGQRHVPGALDVDGRGRAQAIVEARLSSISRSIQDHAERVAAKRARSGASPAEPSAAARMEALRRRVAARGNGGPSAGRDPSAGSSLDCSAAPLVVASCDHAATRVAQHGHSPGSDGAVQRRLSG